MAAELWPPIRPVNRFAIHHEQIGGRNRRSLRLAIGDLRNLQDLPRLNLVGMGDLIAIGVEDVHVRVRVTERVGAGLR